ncbi:substrate-binding periplasmic protein [Psychromonas hadalis]|uniref:substrate-binding periplasmic protein n=1 Tax=Psychromonas hadalis TaxID=211669 RepID=UPI0003B33234|nr:transporter substrate-binding domain-containing protein [Psychromonas hadalis]
MSSIQQGIIAFILLLFYNASVYATSHKLIKIGTIGFPPYGISTHGKLTGIYYDVANILVSKAGYSSHNKVAPYARIIREIKYGDIDMTIMFRYPELEDYVYYVAPLSSLKTVVIGIQGNDFEDINDLNNKKIVYLRGAKFSDAIDNNATIVKYQIKDFLQGIKMLMAGRADAIIGPLEPILSASLQIKGVNVIFGKPLIVDIRTPWIQVSKRNRAHIDIDKLKQSFSEMQSANTLNILRAKYLKLPQKMPLIKK